MLRFLVPAAFALTVLAGCTGGTSPVNGCIDNSKCDEGQACIFAADAVEGDLGTCQDVECLASDGCNLREYCDTETYVCRAGCAGDEDCAAGESCNVETNTCEDYGCRNTTLDCPVGDFCNAVTGECSRDRRDHCEICEPDVWAGIYVCPSSPDGASCYITRADQTDGYCGYYCDPDRADDPSVGCPAGFQCSPLQDGEYVCVADCELLVERGWY